MAKERKTKRQKKASDLRQANSPSSVQTDNLYSLDLSVKDKSPRPSSSTAVSKSDYKYLTSDIRRTSIVTSLIVLFELGVYFISVSS